MGLGWISDSKRKDSAGLERLRTLSPAAITDAGCERELNEDRYAVVESASGLAWLVCDGMGGTAGGELAAQLALEAIRRDLELGPVRPPEEALKSAILQANRVIVLRRQNPAFGQMGTTVVSALFSGPEVVIGHAGDSRAYLIRGSEIEQLTTDHTFVQELVDRGKINPEDALNHPDAHILTRCIGSEPGLMVDAERFWIWDLRSEEQTDMLLLCTDGLYSHLTDKEIARYASENTPQDACAKLVEKAKARGGYDNITVAVIPLGGKLRREPPAGYNPETELRRRVVETAAMEEETAPRNLARDALVVGSLCVLAFFLTAVATIFLVSG